MKLKTSSLIPCSFMFSFYFSFSFYSHVPLVYLDVPFVFFIKKKKEKKR
jgi:hypothetical protein